MARHKQYFKWEVPATVVTLVKAHCNDYDRRAKIINNPNTSPTLAQNFREFNLVIDNALMDIEPGLRSALLTDIQIGRGFDASPIAPFLAKNTYYARKRKLIHDIAVGLHLI